VTVDFLAINMRRYLKDLMKIGITVVGLALVIRQVELNEVGRSLVGAHLHWVAIAFLMVNASLIVRAYRWSLLLRGLGVSMRFRRLVELYYVGNFFNAFLPSGFGGDVVRVLEVARDVPTNTAAGTVILDRLTGLTMLFVMALFIIPWRPNVFPVNFVWIIVVGSLAGLIGGFILIEGSLLRRFGSWLPGPLSPAGDGPVGRLLQAVQGCGWPAIWGALAVSVAFNLILSGYWLLTGLALEQRLAFSFFILVMPLLSVPLLIPSVSGLGPRELLAPVIFGIAGMTVEAAVSLSLLIFVITRLSSLLGAPLYIWSTVRKGRTRRDQGAIVATNAAFGAASPNASDSDIRDGSRG
jgi:uncharacterized membrane protein YbhN (UPF0104 family)